jgi:hypothetical protein
MASKATATSLLMLVTPVPIGMILISAWSVLSFMSFSNVQGELFITSQGESMLKIFAEEKPVDSLNKN